MFIILPLQGTTNREIDRMVYDLYRLTRGGDWDCGGECGEDYVKGTEAPCMSGWRYSKPPAKAGCYPQWNAFIYNYEISTASMRVSGDAQCPKHSLPITIGISGLLGQYNDQGQHPPEWQKKCLLFKGWIGGQLTPVYARISSGW
ncbi:MAG: hypothetical protein U5L09_10535 [Bacteroidales bacterium]|nr:hypothetical protein [Bacteroidales bacterium]